MAFPSVYEMFAPLTTVRKQHFWDYFIGDSLNSRWTFSGTGSTSMQDAVDGGLKIDASSADGFISFNDKRQFAHNGSVIIIVGRRETSNGHRIGFLSSSSVDNLDDVYMQDWSTNTYKILRTGDSSTSSDANSSVTVDTSFHTYKLIMGSSNIKLNIDGVLEVTKTTNRPTAKLQPFLGGYSSMSRVKYCEVYNT